MTVNWNMIEFETSFGNPSQFTESVMPEIALAGKSNVGKSSLINKVFERKNLARVSSSPGKTATVNFYRLDNVRFADLPGYGFAKVSKAEKEKWGELMEAYFSSGRNIARVLILLDHRHLPSEDDITMLSFLKDSGYAFSVILTKTDKLSKKEREETLNSIKKYISPYYKGNLIEFSAQNGEGTDEIRKLFNLDF